MDAHKCWIASGIDCFMLWDDASLPLRWSLIWSHHESISNAIWCWDDQYGKCVNSSPPGETGQHFEDNIFRCIFVNEKFCILIAISLNFSFVRVQLTITQLRLNNSLVPNRRWAIIWYSVDPIPWCIYASLVGDELSYHCPSDNEIMANNNGLYGLFISNLNSIANILFILFILQFVHVSWTQCVLESIWNCLWEQNENRVNMHAAYVEHVDLLRSQFCICNVSLWQNF